jgi:hypothetical protein
VKELSKIDSINKNIIEKEVDKASQNLRKFLTEVIKDHVISKSRYKSPPAIKIAEVNYSPR